MDENLSQKYIQKYIDAGMDPSIATSKGVAEHVELLKIDLKNTRHRRIYVDRVNQLCDIQKSALETFKKKNRDYGDAFATYGSIGVIMRIGDKINRMMSITNSNIQLVNDESLEDTLLDLHNYAAMAVMLLRDNNIK